MKTIAQKILLTSLLLLLVASVSRAADTVPTTPSVLDTAKLKTMLENMGYTVTNFTDTSFQIIETRDNLTIYLVLFVSGDGSELWLKCNLGNAIDSSAVPANIATSLLAGNYTYGPTHFALDAASPPGKFILSINHPFDNRGITPVILRTGIIQFEDTIVKTLPLWNQSNWTAATQPATPPASQPAH